MASYRRQSPGRLEKHKLRYLSLLVPSGDRSKLPTGFLPELISSLVDLRATEDGRPLFVESNEELALGQLQAPMKAHNRVSLRSLKDEAAALTPNDEQTLAEAWVLRPDEAYAEPPDSAAFDAAASAGCPSKPSSKASKPWRRLPVNPVERKATPPKSESARSSG